MNFKKKNIIIYGASRTGKSTLANMLSLKFGYSIIRIDDLITSFEKEIPKLNINHKFDNQQAVFSKITPFISELLYNLNYFNNKNNGIYSILEGSQIDFDLLFKKNNKEDFIIIGLYYDYTLEKFMKVLKENDTENDWSYYYQSEELKNYLQEYIKINEKCILSCNKYNIPLFNTSNQRNNILEKIVKFVEQEIVIKKTAILLELDSTNELFEKKIMKFNENVKNLHFCTETVFNENIKKKFTDNNINFIEKYIITKDKNVFDAYLKIDENFSIQQAKNMLNQILKEEYDIVWKNKFYQNQCIKENVFQNSKYKRFIGTKIFKAKVQKITADYIAFNREFYKNYFFCNKETVINEELIYFALDKKFKYKELLAEKVLK